MTTSQMAKLEDLPDEVLMKVLGYLPVKDKVYGVGKVSRRFTRLVMSCYQEEHDKCSDVDFEMYTEFVYDME